MVIYDIVMRCGFILLSKHHLGTNYRELLRNSHIRGLTSFLSCAIIHQEHKRTVKNRFNQVAELSKSCFAFGSKPMGISWMLLVRIFVYRNEEKGYFLARRKEFRNSRLGVLLGGKGVINYILVRVFR